MHSMLDDVIMNNPLMCIVEKLFRNLVALVFMLRWLKLDADTVTSAG